METCYSNQVSKRDFGHRRRAAYRDVLSLRANLQSLLGNQRSLLRPDPGILRIHGDDAKRLGKGEEVRALVGSAEDRGGLEAAVGGELCDWYS